MKTRLYIISFVILAAGLSASLYIYLTAGDPSISGANYIVVDGVSYAVDPGMSKAYARELERFGGKAAVLFDELNRWFARLWKGRTLAFTLASLSLLASLALLWLAREWPPEPPDS